mmetsp:Transcript_88633/g.286262  ORF Transcript_88633/g.286262 Transcript_88633/m.286262 type:complete len:145 (+) Transcript_88633:1030-1464(+)
MALSSLLAASAAGIYAALPSAAPSELRPFARTLPVEQQKRSPLRRVSTFGVPIYADKSFTMQVHAQCLRLEMDPELFGLYKAYRSMLDKDRGTSAAASSGVDGLHSVATVPGDMVVMQAEAMAVHDIHLAELGRSGTVGQFSGL